MNLLLNGQIIMLKYNADYVEAVHLNQSKIIFLNKVLYIAGFGACLQVFVCCVMVPFSLAL